MRVLLISPLPGLDPPCGDVTYTQTLLAHPPAGVRYETYADALARSALVEHGNGRALRRALRTGRHLGRELWLTAAAKSVSQMRRWRWLFWEPFRFFSVRPGEYDAVHLHVFNAAFRGGLPCPLVVSSGAPQRYLYTEARQYSLRRTERIESAERALGRALGVNVNSYHLPQAARVMAYTEFLKDWYVGRRIMPADRIDIVPIFLPAPPADEVARGSGDGPRRVGFVAKDFAAKGGPTLLRAFERVRRDRPDAELHVVGCPPQLAPAEAAARGIVWTPYVPREELLGRILPSLDVFAYPTHCDCISYVLLEAMSRGLAIATSDYPSMPEAVGYGEAGLVSPVADADALAANILRLLEPAANARYRAAARERFASCYSADAVGPRMRRSYDLAIQSQGQRSPAAEAPSHVRAIG